jgi:hypothetical protein
MTQIRSTGLLSTQVAIQSGSVKATLIKEKIDGNLYDLRAIVTILERRNTML